MIGQIFALLAIVGIILLLRRELALYREHQAREESLRDVRQERAAREQTRPFGGHVEVSPIEPPLAPIAPIAMARSRREQRPGGWAA